MKVPPPELLIQVSNDPSAENYLNVATVRWAVEQPLLEAGYKFGLAAEMITTAEPWIAWR